MVALILSPVGEGSQIGVTPRVQVVDGRQRLPTFQLILAALREIARKHALPDFMEQATGVFSTSRAPRAPTGFEERSDNFDGKAILIWPNLGTSRAPAQDACPNKPTWNLACQTFSVEEEFLRSSHS